MTDNNNKNMMHDFILQCFQITEINFQIAISFGNLYYENFVYNFHKSGSHFQKEKELKSRTFSACLLLAERQNRYITLIFQSMFCKGRMVYSKLWRVGEIDDSVEVGA